MTRSPRLRIGNGSKSPFLSWHRPRLRGLRSRLLSFFACWQQWRRCWTATRPGLGLGLENEAVGDENGAADDAGGFSKEKGSLRWLGVRE